MIMQSLGKKIRMDRLFRGKAGRFMEVLVDHTIARGIQPGLIRIEDTLDRIIAGKPNAVTMHKGLAARFFGKYSGSGVSLILKTSSPSKYNPTCHAWVADMEEAVSYGADGIATGSIFCGKDQLVQMERLGALTKEAAKFGMPVIGHIYPNGEMVEPAKREDWQYVAYAARAGAELGVDVLKVHHSGEPETFARIVEAVPAPVVLAGGSAGNTIRDYVSMARNALDAGAAGVAFGRFVWSYPNTAALIQALQYMVQEDASLDETMDRLDRLERGAKPEGKQE
ncbi:MAG: fructose-bisphosphate aldolase [Deltaproteobacteria bacterium]|nr:fructose-bisphosphate aldolase [Deltaproteobacteria bacterium]